MRFSSSQNIANGQSGEREGKKKDLTTFPESDCGLIRSQLGGGTARGQHNITMQ